MIPKELKVPAIRPAIASRILIVAVAAAVLGGCMGGKPVAFVRHSAHEETPELPGATVQTSAIIADLRQRTSALPASGPLAQVAAAVLDDSRGSAKAELRMAQLAARAKSKNWLPQIGPTLSLSSLGDLAAQLLVQQVLFDNGARRAERDYAAADVESAAVSLSMELNDTVAKGLTAYITVIKARDQAAVTDQAANKISEFQTIIRQRVEGGLSDGADAQVLAQKLAEIRASAQEDRDTASTAAAQLQAMTAMNIANLSSLGDIALPAVLPDTLSVKKAEAEQRQVIAQSKMERAGHLPSLTANAKTGNGAPDLGLTLGINQMLGLNTTDALAAIDASNDAAGARVEETKQSDTQTLATLQAKLQALEAQESRDAAVLKKSESGLSLFYEQYRMGLLSLMELVNMYENQERLAHAHTGMKYDITLTKLEIARQCGILVSGGDI